ncbi:hypothetical protein [Paracidovorax konjaci]|uniref:Regulator of chromosome condensation (RCC1) repeat-containing protein n=1 Tax=Paracidovorax konjaci TaxID=32040 RepID=A0A1I1VIX1_9BURK|nr:hypothetical protein [Paracidovorax konjaci]SFD81013.1 hypothetical protein SAMN04489710_106230 [Paracidovorax konjaci]
MSKVPVSFLKCKVIEKNYYFFAARPDDLDEDAEFSRIFFYDDEDHGNKWRHLDLPHITVESLCVVITAIDGHRCYAALSKEGSVSFIRTDRRWLEKVGDSGVKTRDVLPIYGYLNALKEISGELYACGGGGQIYRRNSGEWVDIAGDLRKSTPDLTQPIPLNQIKLGEDISDIDGYANDDIYAAGMDGIYHYNGVSWTACDNPTDEILTSVLCLPGRKVFACGFNGTILSGNARQGFKDISHYDDNMILTKVVEFQGDLYFSSNAGLFSMNKGEAGSRLQKIQEVDDCEDISVLDDVLLCVGWKTIQIFQSGRWKQLLHPDND